MQERAASVCEHREVRFEKAIASSTSDVVIAISQRWLTQPGTVSALIAGKISGIDSCRDKPTE